MTDDPASRAHDLILYCDGADDAGLPCLHAFTGRARTVAHDTLELLAMLEAERSARRALKERCERQQAILGKATYRACVVEVGR